MDKKLTHDQILDIQKAAVDARLASERDALWGGVSPSTKAATNQASSLDAQMLTDLNHLNDIELVDGSLPLLTWLKNAHRLVASFEHGEVFEKAIKALGGEHEAFVPSTPTPPDTASVHHTNITIHNHGQMVGNAIGPNAQSAAGDVTLHIGEGKDLSKTPQQSKESRSSLDIKVMASGQWQATMEGCKPWTLEDPVQPKSKLRKHIKRLRELDHQHLATNDKGEWATPQIANAAVALRGLAVLVGEALTKALLSDEAKEELTKAVRAGSSGKPALWVIRVEPETHNAELDMAADHALALPWELVRIDGTFPVEKGNLDIAREAVVPGLTGLTTPTQELTLVATVAAPVDQGTLNYEDECYRIWEALGEEEERLLLTDRGTLEDFVDAVKAHSPPVVHFTGHGSPGQLLFEDDAARGNLVDIQKLVSLLKGSNEGLPSLIYLASCHGGNASPPPSSSSSTQATRDEQAENEESDQARTSTDGEGAKSKETKENKGKGESKSEKLAQLAAFKDVVSTAATLQREGFHQVVGYFGPVGDRQSTRAERYFYSELAAGKTAREAVRRARSVSSLALEVDGQPRFKYPMGWAQLVLYHRGQDVPTTLPIEEAPQTSIAMRERKRRIERLDKGVKGEGVKRLQFGFVGRRSPRAELIRRWKDGERLIAVMGLGGLGKTALCTEVLPVLRKAQASPGAKPVPFMALDGRSTRNEDKPIEILWQEVQSFRPLGREWDEEQWDGVLAGAQDDGLTGRALAAVVLAASRICGGLLVYVDDAESLQKDVDGKERGHWRDDELKTFWDKLAKAAQSDGSFGLLTSCRYAPDSLDDKCTLPLSAMREVDVVKVLSWLPTLGKLHTYDRKWVASKVDGHPRTIQFLEGLATRKAQKLGKGGPGSVYKGQHWRKDVLEPIMGDVRKKVDADLLLGKLWNALSPDEQEHLGRCTAATGPVPWSALAALGDEDSCLALFKLGLLSPAPVSGREERWWAPHRLVLDAVGKLWNGDLANAHLTLGRWFADFIEEEDSSSVEAHTSAVKHLCEAQAGNEAWALAKRLMSWMEGKGRYREILMLVEQVMEAKPQGRSLGQVLVRRVDESIRAGLLVENADKLLEQAKGLLEDDDLSLFYTASGNFNSRVGALGKASEYMRQSLEFGEQRYGPEHPSTLTSMSNLAQTLKAQGDLSGARELHEKALEVRTRVLGDEHPSTLMSINNLAGTLYAQGDLSGARELNEKALEVRTRVLGEEHPSTLTSINNLASILDAQGDVSGARELHQKALEVLTRVLGEEHPSTLTSINNLALTLKAQGDLSGAKELNEKAVEVLTRVLGEEHPHTLTSINNLALTLDAQGDVSGAKELNEKAVEVLTRVLGEEHPNTLTSMSNLALTLKAQGDLDGAKELNEKALEVRTRVLGEEHPSTLTSISNLAETFLAQGDLSGAREFYEKALEVLTRVLGEEHPRTQSSYWNYLGMLDIDSPEQLDIHPFKTRPNLPVDGLHLQFGENVHVSPQVFLTALAHSISLSAPGKERIIKSLPLLSQQQFDQLLAIFQEEQDKFLELGPKSYLMLRGQLKHHADQWIALHEKLVNTDIKAQPSQAHLEQPHPFESLAELPIDGFQIKLGDDVGVSPEAFLTSLARSVSLGPDEKERMIKSASELSKDQLQMLMSIFQEEQDKFLGLGPENYEGLKKILKQQAEQWMALRDKIIHSTNS